MNNSKPKSIKGRKVLASQKRVISMGIKKRASKSKIIKIDNKKIKVDLLNNVKPNDIPDKFTGSNTNVKCLIDEVLD